MSKLIQCTQRSDIFKASLPMARSIYVVGGPIRNLRYSKNDDDLNDAFQAFTSISYQIMGTASTRWTASNEIGSEWVWTGPPIADLRRDAKIQRDARAIAKASRNAPSKPFNTL